MQLHIQFLEIVLVQNLMKHTEHHTYTYVSRKLFPLYSYYAYSSVAAMRSYAYDINHKISHEQNFVQQNDILLLINRLTSHPLKSEFARANVSGSLKKYSPSNNKNINKICLNAR